MQTRRPLSILHWFVALGGALLLAACGRGDGEGTGTGAGPGAGNMPPPAVTVMEVRAEGVPLHAELPGRTAPYLIAEVRPQVTGIVEARDFEEGGEVEAGQVLYRIDAATYQAAVDSAKANLARAEAQRHNARLTADRYAELVKTNAISRQVRDEAVAALRQAEAEVAAAQAALQRARIDLDYTRVTAPIAGRIGRSRVTRGALVTANQAEALAVIRQLDPIYVDLTQSSADLLRLRQDLAAGRLRRIGGDDVPVRLLLEDGSEYGREGALAFSEVSVDESTGTVTLRALFPNPDGELLPGMYVRARIAKGLAADAILLPHAAVTRDPRGNAVVMVVGAEDKVEARVVQTAQSLGDKWVVTQGLAPGERVIVEGLQRVRPGAQVQPQPPAATAPAAQQAAPAAH